METSQWQEHEEDGHCIRGQGMERNAALGALSPSPVQAPSPWDNAVLAVLRH